MKRFFVIFSVALALIASASSASAQFRAGFGYSLMQNVDRYGEEKETSVYHGFNIAALYDAELMFGSWGELAVVSGLSYDYLSQGRRFDPLALLGLDARSMTTEHYLSVPVMAKYGYSFVPGIVDAYVMAGPSLSFGLVSQTEYSVNGRFGNLDVDGNAKFNNYSGRITSSNLPDQVVDEIKAKDRKSGYGWFDVKLGIAAGVELFDAVELRLGYNWGLVDRFAAAETDLMDRRSNQFYVCLAYCFM